MMITNDFNQFEKKNIHILMVLHNYYEIYSNADDWVCSWVGIRKDVCTMHSKGGVGGSVSTSRQSLFLSLIRHND